MKLLTELITVTRVNDQLPQDAEDSDDFEIDLFGQQDIDDNVDMDDRPDGFNSSTEDEEDELKYVVVYDYTGQGQGDTETFGPFSSSTEAYQWIVDNGHEGDDRYYVDVEGWPGEENEETGLGKYDQQGNVSQGAPIDTEPEGYEDGLPPDDEDLVDPESGEQEQGDEALDAMANKASEDPDKQGLIRKVPKAHLVYKRQTEEGQYEELWIYNSSQIKDEMEIRKSILAATDIPVTKTTSPDGQQSYELWTAGNIEMVLIRGLPN